MIQHIKEISMKKLTVMVFLIIFFSLFVGCKQELVDENIKLKARVAGLEEQLKLCKGDLEKQKQVEDVIKYDPNITNPNDNTKY